MVTVLGNVAWVELDERVIVIPPVGAVPSMLMVAVEEAPPTKVLGLSEKPLMTGGSMLQVAFAVFPG
jgi:hypothetical protein